MNRFAIFTTSQLILSMGLLIGCTPQASDKARFGSPSTVAAKSFINGQANCTSEELSSFEQPMGEPLNLEREALPRGLYLAKVSELLVEKRLDGNQAARFLVREVPGGKPAEVVCTEHADHLKEEFDVSLQGLVKFDTSSSQRGTGLTVRQFYFFNRRGGQGAMISNPRMLRPAHDLKSFLKSNGFSGELFKVSDHTYLLKSQAVRHGLSARLNIQLELIQ